MCESDRVTNSSLFWGGGATGFSMKDLCPGNPLSLGQPWMLDHPMNREDPCSSWSLQEDRAGKPTCHGHQEDGTLLQLTCRGRGEQNLAPLKNSAL